MLKNRNQNKKDLVNHVKSKGLVIGTLVILFMAAASIGMVVDAEEEKKCVISLESGYPVPFSFPSLSSDWEKVAFSTYEYDSGNKSAKLTLWAVNMDGSDKRKLDERIESQSDEGMSYDDIVGWSPDGEYVANWKVHWIFSPSELWLISSDGADKKKLVEGITASEIIWNPDGAKFAYTKRYDTMKFLDGASHTESTKNFYITDINENSNTFITEGTPLLWTTDDEIIYYKKEFTGKGDDVHYTTWKIDLNRAIPTKLGSINTIPEAISSDGSKIAYEDHGIWIVNIDGSNLRQLTVSDEDLHLHPIWSPDGKRIAFLSWEEGIQHGIWVINSDGSDQKKLTSATSSWGWGLEGQVWNKNSSKIVCVVEDWTNMTAFDDYINITNDIYILDVGEPPSITPLTGETPAAEEEPGFEAITPTPSPTPTPTPEEGVPGFEAVFAIAGLLAVAYLLRRKG